MCCRGKKVDVWWLDCFLKGYLRFLVDLRKEMKLGSKKRGRGYIFDPFSIILKMAKNEAIVCSRDILSRKPQIDFVCIVHKLQLPYPAPLVLLANLLLLKGSQGIYNGTKKAISVSCDFFLGGGGEFTTTPPQSFLSIKLTVTDLLVNFTCNFSSKTNIFKVIGLFFSALLLPELVRFRCRFRDTISS